MPILEVQATLRSSSNLPRDNAVNVLHYNIGALDDFGIVTARVADAYVSQLSAGYLGGVDQVTVKAYSLDDALPRPAMNVQVRPITYSAPGPREVALCLSFYGDRNLPSRRGRLFIGPWSAQFSGVERPSQSASGPMARLITFAQALDGGSVGQWGVWSRAKRVFYPITNAWVDNEWDTQRSRGQRATIRQSVSL